MTQPQAGLFRGLYDDAAIFPPGNAPLGDAVHAHRDWRDSAYAAMVGAFVCAAARLDELVSHGADFPVSVTLPASQIGEVLARGDLDLASIEVPYDAAAWDTLADAGRRTRVYVEVPLPELTPEVAQRIAAAGTRLKLRTGGADAAMFPTAAALAHGLATAVAADLPFKLTAGLHNVLRHRDPETGFEHHGFGNVLVATAAAVDGAGAAEVAAILDITDGPTVARRLRELSEREVAAVRQRFLSFGTCSIQEPLDDLDDLGLLPSTTGTGT